MLSSPLYFISFFVILFGHHSYSFSFISLDLASFGSLNMFKIADLKSGNKVKYHIACCFYWNSIVFFFLVEVFWVASFWLISRVLWKLILIVCGRFFNAFMKEANFQWFVLYHFTGSWFRQTIERDFWDNCQKLNIDWLLDYFKIMFCWIGKLY